MTTPYPEYKPGDFFVTWYGTRYRAEAGTPGRCNGCAGYGPGPTSVCASLPVGCSSTDIIWIKEESA
jgi:hypothetical protein